MIDLFVDSLSLKEYGFRMDYFENGRPAYHPSDRLKEYLWMLLFSFSETGLAINNYLSLKPA